MPVNQNNWLHYQTKVNTFTDSCGLVSGQDWLHFFRGDFGVGLVADWSQAKIGYTAGPVGQGLTPVADWSQAKIGYTQAANLATFVKLRIGLRPRLVTLNT